MLEEITKLTKEYHELVRKDAYKDRDCHFYINTVWSYGQPPVYRVEHYGYVSDDVSIQCQTYEEALERLRLLLIRYTGELSASIEKNKRFWDDYESHKKEMKE